MTPWVSRAKALLPTETRRSVPSCRPRPPLPPLDAIDIATSHSLVSKAGVAPVLRGGGYVADCVSAPSLPLVSRDVVYEGVGSSTGAAARLAASDHRGHPLHVLARR